MHSFDKLRENAERELKIIEDKGLDKGNIELAGKLTEMIKGLDKIEMMQDGGNSYDGYSRDMEDYSRDRMGRGGYSRDGYSRDGDYSNDYDRGNSYRRGRNQRTGQYMHRPNYSRLSGDDTDMDEYKRRKSEYSNARSGENKERMLDAIDRLVGNICDGVAQIFRDCECTEERDIIMNHLDGLQRKIKR